MIWGAPHAWWLAVPVLVALGLELWRRHAIAVNLPRVARVWAGRDELTFREHKLAHPVRWLLWLGLLCLVGAMAKPRHGVVPQTVYDPAIDVVVAMDLSRSMLAKDVRPSRLEQAKILTYGMLDNFVGVRVGFVPFSGVSYVQLPLNLDYQILIETLGLLSPDSFPRGGTNVTAMLNRSIEAFGEQERAGRFLVVISDGETSDASWREVLPRLVEHQIKVIAVGVGTPTGAVIPAKAGGVIVDAGGNEVLSRFSPLVLEELAKATGGLYLSGNSYVALAEVINDLVAQAPQNVPADEGKETLGERFQWLVLPGVLLLLASYWLEVPYRPHARRIELPEAPPAKANRRGLRGVAAGAALVAIVLTIPLRLDAIDGDENAVGPGKRPNSPVDGVAILLSKRIEQMVTKPAPNAIDYAGYIIDAKAYLETKLRIREKPPLSVIRDTLAAAKAGAALDPEAADWALYERELAEMLRQTLAPATVYAAESAENVSLEALLAMAEDEQKKQRVDPGEEEEDDGSEIPDDVLDKPARKVEGSAFGDLVAEDPAVPEPPPPEAAARRPRPAFGMPVSSGPPDLSLPLHRLGQIRTQDSPARLHQLMESDDFPPPIQGSDW